MCVTCYELWHPNNFNKEEDENVGEQGEDMKISCILEIPELIEYKAHGES